MKKSNIKLSFLMAIVVSFLLPSCNVEKNRKLLSVFFDGVPEQKSVVIPKGENAFVKKKIIKRNRIQIVSFHPDFKTKKCSKCHNRNVSNFIKTDRKKLCFTCHKQEKFKGKYIHGPVAVNACNVCHDPHKSVNRKLLVEDGKKLCVLCHRIPLTGGSLPCKGDNCLECHEPHISSNKNFLRINGNTKTRKADRSISLISTINLKGKTN